MMKQFFTDFTEEELKHCINSAYDSKFDTEVIAPLVKVGDAYHLELFHGATIAFKDMAFVDPCRILLTTSAKKNNVKNEIVILTATSGDTGKAALAGFADVPGTRIIVFYPKGGRQPYSGAADGDSERSRTPQLWRSTEISIMHRAV